MLEALVRKYANLKGEYITKDQHIEDLNGCLYEPILQLNPLAQNKETKNNILRNLIKWALG